MDDKINVFVSYTLRDGSVSLELLKRIHEHLLEIAHPFVHALEDANAKHQQWRVVRALLQSHILVLLESPGVLKSPWVRLELLLGRLRLIPIVKINVADLLLRESSMIG